MPIRRQAISSIEHTFSIGGEVSTAANYEQQIWTIPAVPPRYDFRLEDLRGFHLVLASCRACGHKAIIANSALQQGRPNYTRLSDLERRLCCQKCGARGKASLEVELRPRD